MGTSEHANQKDDLYLRAIEVACSSDKLRRELLWLRAMEKRDEESAIDLEQIDPELRSRVAEVLVRADGLPPDAAGDVYGRAQDERLAAIITVIRRQAR